MFGAGIGYILSLCSFSTQVLANMIDFGMDPQQALDMPRLCINTSLKGPVLLEEGIPDNTVKGLRKLGHNVKGPIVGHGRGVFGKGQIVTKKKGDVKGGGEKTVYWAGSDPRGDGMAIAY
jgi:gamma-glutamyltranspeptidase/glutathione hydrolase